MVFQRFIAAWLIGGLCTAAMPARATVWTGGATVSIGGVDPGWLTVAIPDFDPGAGTIVGASVTLDGWLQASVFVGAGAGSAGAVFDNAVQFASGPGSLALGTVRAAPTGPASMGERVAVDVTGALSPDYARSARDGTLDVGLFFLALLDPAGGGAASETLSFTGRVDATVTYADPVPLTLVTSAGGAAPALVPEPATAALVGAGLVGAGLSMRRRR